ncbi:hypothetical protein CNMCM5623_003907 [Aspergillus felis]|uniref:Uncharacterized protein n=1 Tax=Aspergillus felis TaxID=1287682 RepID=A0A8H6UL07_9EURO|nr:hypothetical protein CNMCM5623_003907 [Aspergillus felis]
MDTLYRFFCSERHPDKGEFDDIYPTHFFDNSRAFRFVIMTWTLQFNDVLDAHKLYDSLSRLLEIGDWRKLGGRLRRGKNRKLEIHVPKQFTEERPAVFFTHDVFAMTLAEHPLASQLPRSTDGPSIQRGAPDFRQFAARPDAPSTLVEFLNNDIPQLSLHITSFEDATLVSLSWPHILMDAMGQQALLRGWSLVLANREAEVPLLLGAREDVLYDAADPSVELGEDSVFESRRLKGLGLFWFILRYACDMLWNRVVEARTVYLPKEAVNELRRQAQQDILDHTTDDNIPWISDGDVLMAWMSRIVALSQPSSRPATLISAIDVRPHLPAIVKSGGVYVQNMVLGAFTSISSQLAIGPIGCIALAHRRALLEQATEPQFLGLLQALRKLWDSGRDTVLLCGEAGASLFIMSNWTKADFIHTADFQPAVTRQGEESHKRRNPLGTMIYHHFQPLKLYGTERNVVVLYGKDHGGNYWLTGHLLPRTWTVFREAIDNLST